MQAFSLIEFAYREDEPGFFMVLKYQINGKWETDVKLFKQLGAADLYIKQIKKTWLLFYFENWLLTVHPNIHIGSPFQDVWFTYEDLCNCELINICDRIIKGQNKLSLLLNESNNENGSDNLKQIISFCKKEIEATTF